MLYDELSDEVKTERLAPLPPATECPADEAARELLRTAPPPPPAEADPDDVVETLLLDPPEEDLVGDPEP